MVSIATQVSALLSRTIIWAFGHLSKGSIVGRVGRNLNSDLSWRSRYHFAALTSHSAGEVRNVCGKSRSSDIDALA